MSTSTRSEKSIELAVVKFAKERGWLVRKMNGLGYAGWPDRAFFKGGECFFIEFKKWKEPLDPLQVNMFQQLAGRGFSCYRVDNVEYGKEVVTRHDT